MQPLGHGCNILKYLGSLGGNWHDAVHSKYLPWYLSELYVYNFDMFLLEWSESTWATKHQPGLFLPTFHSSILKVKKSHQ